MSEQQAVQSGRGCMTALGILSIFAGMAAIGSPFLISAYAAIIIGVSLIMGGIMELMMAFTAGDGKSRSFIFLAGILAIALGGYVVTNPEFAVALFGYILIVFFLLDGFIRSAHAISFRPIKGWGWQLFSGLISIALGIGVWVKMPLSAWWVIGTVIGIRLLFAGFGILFLTGAVAAAEKSIEA